MKKAAKLILTFLLVLVCLPVRAENITVSAPGVQPSGLPSVTVSWTKKNDFYILTASWLENADQWELCLTGLPEKLTGAQISLLVSAARQGKVASVTGSGLIDAEKATNKLPLSYGEKLYEDKISREDKWGDSDHCWAASVSDMFTLTGWLGKAAETDTGRQFADEDDLFGFFNRAFMNEGSYHAAALEWAFTGAITEDLAVPRDNITGPLIRDPADKGIFKDLRADSCASTDEYMSQLVSRLPLLKQGAALGASLSLCSSDYPLKNDPDKYAFYETRFHSFVHYELPVVSWDDVQQLTFVPNAENGTPVIVEYDDAKDIWFEKESGAAADKNEVWIGEFVYDAEQDMWFNLDPGSYYSEDDEPFYIRSVLHSESEVDTEHPEHHVSLTGGEHAVTIMGYVMDLSESEPARRIKAVILSDSDNDAAIYRPDQSSVRREDRPNTYTMYPAEVIPDNSGDTISLNGYLPYTLSLIFSVTALMPAPDNKPDPPPLTGDAFPFLPYTAALLLAASVLIILRKISCKSAPR